MRFLEVVVALAVKEFEQRRPKLTSRKRRKINSPTRTYLFMKVLCYVCLVSHLVVKIYLELELNWNEFSFNCSEYLSFKAN